MFLKSMTLHNFRCFTDLKVNFNNRLTVLVGSNGAGKSTVLEAAAIAAGTLTFAMDGLTNYGIKKVTHITSVLIWEAMWTYSRNFRLKSLLWVRLMGRKSPGSET